MLHYSLMNGCLRFFPFFGRASESDEPFRHFARLHLSWKTTQKQLVSSVIEKLRSVRHSRIEILLFFSRTCAFHASINLRYSSHSATSFGVSS